MSEANGNSQSRFERIEEMLERHSTMLVDFDIRHQTAMDRIDASIERQILANDAAHERFEAEDKRLLTAQILMNGSLQTLTENTLTLSETTQKLIKVTQTLSETTQTLVESMTTLELKMEETTDKLNGLIDTVDGFIRKRE